MTNVEKNAPSYDDAVKLVEEGKTAINQTRNFRPKLSFDDKVAISLLFHHFGFTRAVIAKHFNVHPRTVTTICGTTGKGYAKVRQVVSATPVQELVRKYVPQGLYDACVKIRNDGVSARDVSERKSMHPSKLEEARTVQLRGAGGVKAMRVIVRCLMLPENWTYATPDGPPGEQIVPCWGYSVSSDVYGAPLELDDPAAGLDNIFICRRINAEGDASPDYVRTGSLFKNADEAERDAQDNYRLVERFGGHH